MNLPRRTFLLACGSAPLASAAGEFPRPPAEHPRLYLRARHAAGLRARFEHPALQPLVERMRVDARGSAQRRVEWDALHYLISPEPAQGRRIVEEGLKLLQASELPDRNDACRYTGRMMVTGAMVYDWLYPLLTAGEKQAFIAEFIRLAKTQECGYPPVKQGAVTGHNSEAMLMRDVMSAGIAIYDEHPEMYELAAGRFFREHLPARNWFYPGHAYHQGDSYGPYRYSWDTVPLFIFDRMGAGNVYNPEQRWVPYHFVYSTRPDGQRLRAGDTFSHSAPRGQAWPEGLGTILTASYYGDGVLLSQYMRQGSAAGDNTIFEFLWRDPDLRPQPIAKLPLSRYFGSPFGWMIARTGWDDDAVIAEMKVNEYNFCNHQHLDAGAFQIYYKGSLAIDSGLYSGSGGAYGSDHCKNYYWRTIAHNSLLVHAPNEDFGVAGYGNDGGQRLPNRRSEARTLEVLRAPENGYRTGEVLAHGFGPVTQDPLFTLLHGDLTRAYSDKVRQVRRESVFLNLRNKQVPAALVVFDQVVSADPAFRKYWLLHSLGEPRIERNSATIESGGGRLILDVLLPGAAAVSKVEGFNVFGKSYPNSLEPERLKRGSAEIGEWRIEVCPKEAAAEDLFLTVMQVTDREGGARMLVTLLDAGDRTGCVIEAPGVSWAVLFRKDHTRSGEPARFAVPEGRPFRYLVADLAPGEWRVERAGGRPFAVRVPEDSAAACFVGPAGAWTLRRE